MSTYRHVLAAVEIDEDDGPRVLRRAVALARCFDARLSLVHVVEYLPVDPAGDALLATPLDLTNERRDQAEQRIESWCQAEGITLDGQWVTVGGITQEILRARDQAEADLIVIGHRTRHGLAALFGATEDGVFHRAPCDVLALHLE